MSRPKTTPPVFSAPKDPTGADRQARWRAAREAERAAMVKALDEIAHHAKTLREARQIAEWTLLMDTQ